MELMIRKRNGNIVEFKKEKVVDALTKAFLEVDEQIYETDTINDIANDIEFLIRGSALVKDGKIYTVEEIQDIIEDLLMRSERKDVAKAYIRYRYKREVAREYTDEFLTAIKEKIEGSNIENQNANVDELSFGGRMGEASRVITKKYALDNNVSKMARENHEKNMIYIHDLDSYALGMHNCLTIPFDDLLKKGFDTRQTDVRTANSVNTAFQLVAVIFQLESLQQFGGVSASHIDWTMVPYVRKSFLKHYADGMKYLTYDCPENHYLDKFMKIVNDEMSIEDEYYQEIPSVYQYAIDMTRRETHQAVEGMYHNLNTLQSRSGNQLPFTSINYGTCSLPEGRMVIEAILDVSIEGLGRHHKTSIFPCGIFQVSRLINKYAGTPNYDLYQKALRSTAQRLYPNYANIDWSGNAGYDPEDPRTYFSTMGCRTANGWDINGLGQLKDGRGNICPVTIIMPTLAMMAKEKASMLDHNECRDTVDIFLDLLDEKIHEAKDMLIERFEHICAQDASSARFLYDNGLMAGYIPEEGIRSALKHGTLAIGNLGLAETLQILIGKDHTTSEGMDVAKHIYLLFKNRCTEFKEEYKLNFGVYMTPAENLCYTAMKKFQQQYGKIPNISDKDFFTNSMHVPVWKEMSPFEKIDIESQLTGYSSAGCITYIELDTGAKNNIKALEQIVNYAMDKDIPYFAINVPSDTCLDCGYTDELNDVCPECGGSNIQHLRRVTGYLTGDYKSAFNLGKQQETELRVKHKKFNKTKGE